MILQVRNKNHNRSKIALIRFFFDNLTIKTQVAECAIAGSKALLKRCNSVVIIITSRDWDIARFFLVRCFCFLFSFVLFWHRQNFLFQVLTHSLVIYTTKFYHRASHIVKTRDTHDAGFMYSAFTDECIGSPVKNIVESTLK